MRGCFLYNLVVGCYFCFWLVFRVDLSWSGVVFELCWFLVLGGGIVLFFVFSLGFLVFYFWGLRFLVLYDVCFI